MKPIRAEVRNYNKRPTIFLNDKPYLPYIYSLTDCPGGRLSYEEIPSYSIRKFADIGVKLYQLDVFLDDMWKEDDTLNIEMAKKQIKGVVRHCPDAGIFFRFHVSPPQWWNHKYPEECVKYANTDSYYEENPYTKERYMERDTYHIKRHSYASDRWIKDVSEKFAAFLNEMYESEEGNHLIGIQPATGVYGENHYWGFMNNEPDVSDVMTKKFQKYLSLKYGKDFKDTVVPGVEERKFTSDGIFRDPLKERMTIDYYEFQHRLVAEKVVYFCKFVKDNWKRPIITGAFYGYYVSLFGRAATGGHLFEEIVLSSPYIDYLSAPQAYNRNLREIGGAGASRGLVDSVRMNNKLWLDEMDQPTHEGTRLGGMPVYDLEKSLQILRRNVLTSFVKGEGLWFYDFGPYNNSGWWNHPRYIEEIKELKNTLEEYHKNEYESSSDVLLVFDTKTFMHTANSSALDPITDSGCINQAYPEILKSGASVDAIYLSDLEKADLYKYKCIIFMNAFVISEDKKNFIKANVLKDGRNIIWFFAPGYCNGKENNTKFVENLTGFELVKTDPGDFSITVMEETFTINMKKETSKLDWVFIPSGFDNIWGEYVKGMPGVVSKKLKDWTSWFSSLPVTSADALRYILKNCGVHIYNEESDALMEGSGILMLHTKNGGEKNITLKSKKEVVFFTQPSETVLIDTKTGEIIRKG